MKRFIYLILLIMLVILANACRVSRANTQPNNMTSTNYVPDKETAILIAEAIWLPIYGEKIYNQKPYIVSLIKDTVWIVTGTLTENELGGVAYIEIQKKDCKILKVTHGK